MTDIIELIENNVPGMFWKTLISYKSLTCAKMCHENLYFQQIS